jgi:hypothetical protein
MRRVLLPLLLLGMVSAGIGVFAWSRGSTPAASSAAESAAAGDVAVAMRVCTALQGEQLQQYEPAVQCYMDVLRTAASSGGFEKVLALAEELGTSNAYAACHSAGHRLGVEFVTEGRRMHEVLADLFEGRPGPSEEVCTMAIVHGLVQGHIQGDPPFELEYLAEQCLSLEAVNPRYANECAHYFGHAAWKSVKEINLELAAICELLAEGVESYAENSCLGGAVMDKYRRQDSNYDPSIEGAIRNPPSYEEIESLCDPFESARAESRDACWGGTGWLLANRADALISDSWVDDAAGRARAVDVYIDAINRCEGPSCLENFLTHFRVADLHNGVAVAVCRSDRLDPDLGLVHLRGVCEDQLRRRAGVELFD